MSVSQPSASSRDKIREQMERMRPTFTLMYCSEDLKESPATFKYEQRTFRLPPMQKVAISDVTGVPPEKAYDRSLGGQPQPWHGRTPKDRVTIAPAEKVVSHGLGLLWRRGVVLLTGEPGDVAEIERGKAAWRVWRQHQDEVVLGAFHKRMEDFVSDPRNRHLPRPVMGKLEREAQSRLDSFRLQESGAPVDANLRCPHSGDGCAYWSADADEMDRHVRASHGHDTVLTADTEAIDKALEEREVKRQEKRRAELEKKRAELEASAKAAMEKEAS